MRLPTAALFSFLSDIAAPPRTTEKVVRGLTLDGLREFRPPGSLELPYHDPAVTALVWELKYYANKRALALGGALVAEALLDVAAEEIGKPLLLPVPMHLAKRKQRGHNQTELLCRQALKEVGEYFDYAPRALIRVKDTPPQQTLPNHLRRKNVRGAMTADAARVKGRVCVVVDDVATTGATFEEAERALRKAGARKVVCVALAHS